MQINVGLNARANVRVGVFSPDLIENFLRGEGNALRMILVQDRKSTRLNSSHSQISYAVFCLKKKKKTSNRILDSRGSAVEPRPDSHCFVIYRVGTTCPRPRRSRYCDSEERRTASGEIAASSM